MKTKLSTSIALAMAMTVSGLTLSACSNGEQTATADGSSNEVTTLRFSHFMTANDNINTEGFEP